MLLPLLLLSQQGALPCGQGHVISEWTRPSAVDAAGPIVEFYRTHLR